MQDFPVNSEDDLPRIICSGTCFSSRTSASSGVIAVNHQQNSRTSVKSCGVIALKHRSFAAHSFASVLLLLLVAQASASRVTSTSFVQQPSHKSLRRLQARRLASGEPFSPSPSPSPSPDSSTRQGSPSDDREPSPARESSRKQESPSDDRERSPSPDFSGMNQDSPSESPAPDYGERKGSQKKNDGDNITISWETLTGVTIGSFFLIGFIVLVLYVVKTRKYIHMRREASARAAMGARRSATVQVAELNPLASPPISDTRPLNNWQQRI